MLHWEDEKYICAWWPKGNGFCPSCFVKYLRNFKHFSLCAPEHYAAWFFVRLLRQYSNNATSITITVPKFKSKLIYYRDNVWQGAVNCFLKWATKLAWSWVSAQLIDLVPCSRISCLNTVCQKHVVWTRSWGHQMYETCLLHYSWHRCVTTGG